MTTSTRDADGEADIEAVVEALLLSFCLEEENDRRKAEHSAAVARVALLQAENALLQQRAIQACLYLIRWHTPLSTCLSRGNRRGTLQVLAAPTARKPVAAGESDPAVSAARYASMLSQWTKLQADLAGLTSQCLLQGKEAEVTPIPSQATTHVSWAAPCTCFIGHCHPQEGCHLPVDRGLTNRGSRSMSLGKSSAWQQAPWQLSSKLCTKHCIKSLHHHERPV